MSPNESCNIEHYKSWMNFQCITSTPLVGYIQYSALAIVFVAFGIAIYIYKECLVKIKKLINFDVKAG